MTIAECNSPVSQRIAQIVEDSGVKQRVIAKRAGYSSQQFNDMINGRRLIRINDIPALAKALDVPPSDLFKMSNDTQPSPPHEVG